MGMWPAPSAVVLVGSTAIEASAAPVPAFVPIPTWPTARMAGTGGMVALLFSEMRPWGPTRSPLAVTPMLAR